MRFTIRRLFLIFPAFFLGVFLAIILNSGTLVLYNGRSLTTMCAGSARLLICTRRSIETKTFSPSMRSMIGLLERCLQIIRSHKNCMILLTMIRGAIHIVAYRETTTPITNWVFIHSDAMARATRWEMIMMISTRGMRIATDGTSATSINANESTMQCRAR